MTQITVEAQDGERHASVLIHPPSHDWLEKINSTGFSMWDLTARIEALDLPAEAKLILERLATVSARVGDTLIFLGRSIVKVTLLLFSKFPLAGLGVILGSLLGAIISSIPILGFLFGAFITPVAAAFGLAAGAWHDFKDIELDRKIREAVTLYEPLQGSVSVTD